MLYSIRYINLSRCLLFITLLASYKQMEVAPTKTKDLVHNEHLLLGSLSNTSYCSGYRISVRMKTFPYSRLQNTGFGCV